MLKDDYIQIKLPKELKQQFFDKAKENAQNPSELIRRWIAEYVETK
jgi:metal-responsive CopG/Arc/MetJ family transcriptional regulator